ncbi:MAG: serine/threonine protein kinase [Myxococcaceae bacterium]|nr:serine/threonine protein kinase [Myxococcaceae bacterium]
MWFGRYRLTSRIATGGMAEVYVGRHISEAGEFGPMVAIKRLLPHLVKDHQIVRMFLNEARITAQIHHPNVVGIIDLGQEGGEPFIAMELLDGRTFAELREKAAETGRRVPTGIMLRILCEACRGLDAAHNATDEEGRPLMLVHRDFTPDNVHVGSQGDVKVIDFGVAKTASWGAGTEPGTLKGKFFYMSPEMILAKPVDHRADVFAAGVMLYEQLCGHRPFTGTSVEEVVLAIAAGKPKPPRVFDPAVPMLLEAVCLRALAHDVSARFQSLLELVEAIEQVGGEAQVGSGGEVAEYLGTLFPPEKDPKRQTLRKAREADPSVPNGQRPDGANSGEGASGGDRPQLQVVDDPAQPAASAPTRGAAARKPLPGWVPKAIGGALVLALAVGGAGWFFNRPPLSPADALKQAAVEGAPRARLLLAMGKNPKATDAQFEAAGKLLLDAKEYEEALELSESWLAHSPKSARACLLEGRAASAVRKGKRAEAALGRADALMPDDPAANLALASMREAQGDSSGALEQYTRALKKRPSAELLMRQGYLLSQAGRLEEAAKALTQVLSKELDPAAAAELAFVRYRQNNFDEAGVLLRRALKKAPQLMVGHYYLGTVRYQQGDVKGARDSYLEADRLAAPDDPRALIALCELEAQTKAPTLEETRKKISDRFAKEAPGLLGRCTPTP